MSYYQRLINKFIDGLVKDASLKYQLNFLRIIGNQDPAALQMLYENLNTLSKDIQNKNLKNIIDIQSTWDGLYSKKFIPAKLDKDKKTDTRTFIANEIQKASEHYEYPAVIFYYESSIKYSLIIDYQNFKSKIGLAYLMTNNFQEALNICKETDPQISFCACLGLADVDRALSYIPFIEDFNQNQKIITSYELIHMIFFVFLASQTTTYVSQYFQNKQSILNQYLVPFISELVGNFINRNFIEVKSQFSKIEEILKFSIYTNGVTKKIINAIERNILANALDPFYSIKFSTIEKITGFNRNEIIKMVQPLIRSGRLNGKINLVSNEYHGGQQDSVFLHEKTILEKNIYIQQEIDASLYVNQAQTAYYLANSK